MDDQLGAISPVAQGTRPVTAALRTKMRSPAKSLEITERRIAQDDHRPTVAAVAAVGSAAGHVGLATEAQAAVAAGASRNEDPCPVMEHPDIVDEAGAGWRDPGAHRRPGSIEPDAKTGSSDLRGGGEHRVERAHDRYGLIERQQGAL
jgi:hypothetical protein